MGVDASGNKATLNRLLNFLLNEFLKGQKRLVKLEAILAQQVKAMDVLMA